MRFAITLVFAFLLMASGSARAAEPVKPGRPNIIFVLADDLGIDGVSAYGGEAHKTPHIDALAASGLRFSTAYAAPLCGPSRSLLMTGRYAFRTGGITNQSWRPGGPGAKSADEYPVARILKEAGYATGQAGKWRQVGELPGDWGFDEFITDNTAGGWYWKTNYNKNGKEITLPDGTYGPDVVQDFTFDFIRRHKDQPFFFYYATHLVHKPTLRTPDTSEGTTDVNKLYDENIRYMDKQLGALVAELEKLGLRQNTLIIFAGDNGTAAGYPTPIHGRLVNGAKGSLLEGGSRVPFIASWPAVTPAGKVVDDLVSFADPLITFAELAGAKLPTNVKYDGQSFAPQLRGQPGTPRAWAYVQLGQRWFLRERGFKLNQAGELFDMSDAPFVEKPVAPEADTEQSKAARQRLATVLADLNPAGGKTDVDAGPRRNNKIDQIANPAAPDGPWKSGDALPGEQAPKVAQKAFEISAEIEPAGTTGVVLTQGGAAYGYAIHLNQGKLAFSVREGGELTTITSKEALGNGKFQVTAALQQDGTLTLAVNGRQVAAGKASGSIAQQPKAGLFVGKSGRAAVADFDNPGTFSGKVTNARVKIVAAK